LGDTQKIRTVPSTPPPFPASSSWFASTSFCHCFYFEGAQKLNLQRHRAPALAECGSRLFCDKIHWQLGCKFG
jgi:hypothetical protein